MQVDTKITQSAYHERSPVRTRTDGSMPFSLEAGYAETDKVSETHESRGKNAVEAYGEMKLRGIDKSRKRAPYDHLAQDGVINYKGVTFLCDAEKNRITLGDVRDPNKCLKVSLKGGGVLMANYDNIGDLTKAITMFSPEDQERIMRAITIYKMSKRAQKVVEDVKAGDGDSAKSDEEEEEASKKV